MPSGHDDEAEHRRTAQRLEALEGRLAALKPKERAPAGQLGAAVDQANLAWRMVVELVAGLLVGFAIGFGLDWVFGTQPIMLVLFVLAGMWAGVKTMMRTAREIGAGPPGAAQAVADDEDRDGDTEDDWDEGQDGDRNHR